MKKTVRWIIGVHALEEFFRKYPKKILEVICQESFRKKTIFSKLEKAKIPIKCKPKQAITSVVHTDSHQGVIAKVVAKPYVDEKDLLHRVKQKPRSLILVLDRIFDPQNLGAILRVSECFQVDGVVISKHRSSDITPIVSKTSSGASELIEISMVSNLAEFTRKAQKIGFETIVADDQAEHDLFSFSFPSHALLIMGSEGVGVQPLLQKKADRKVFIPMFGQISSLNVSQATSIFLSFWRKSCL